MIEFNNRKHSTKVFLLFAAFIIFQSHLFSQSKEEQSILETFKNRETVVYKTVDGIELDMIIFYPEPKKVKRTNPWMMHVHGGGWAGGSKYKNLRKSYLGTLRSLLENGVICVTIEYRRTRGNSNAYDAVVDSKDAARFLLKNAKKYKLDAKKYGVWGGSAGGHLSLLTALGKDSDYLGDKELTGFVPEFKCVASYFPATSLINPDLVPGSLFEEEKHYTRILGGSLEEHQELAKLLSPTEQLTKSSPPILLVHGENDVVLPIINSTYMVEVAKEKNADVELLTIKRAGHSFSGPDISPSFEELNQYVTDFILSHLK